MNLTVKGILKMAAQRAKQTEPLSSEMDTHTVCSLLLYYLALPHFMKSLLCSNLVSYQMIHSLSELDLKCTQQRETVKWQTCLYRRSDKRKAKNSALKAQESESNLTSFFFLLFSHLAGILLISGTTVMGYQYQWGWLQSLYLAWYIFTLTRSTEECLCLVYVNYS